MGTVVSRSAEKGKPGGGNRGRTRMARMLRSAGNHLRDVAKARQPSRCRFQFSAGYCFRFTE